jgi:hypothetical protein
MMSAESASYPTTLRLQPTCSWRKTPARGRPMCHRAQQAERSGHDIASPRTQFRVRPSAAAFERKSGDVFKWKRARVLERVVTTVLVQNLSVSDLYQNHGFPRMGDFASGRMAGAITAAPIPIARPVTTLPPLKTSSMPIAARPLLLPSQGPTLEAPIRLLRLRSRSAMPHSELRVC